MAHSRISPVSLIQFASYWLVPSVAWSFLFAWSLDRNYNKNYGRFVIFIRACIIRGFGIPSCQWGLSWGRGRWRIVPGGWASVVDYSITCVGCLEWLLHCCLNIGIILIFTRCLSNFRVACLAIIIISSIILQYPLPLRQNFGGQVLFPSIQQSLVCGLVIYSLSWFSSY